ncbi:MAG TPA: hypothetical protein VIL20_20755 [Sandaracinaceae bacterium]
MSGLRACALALALFATVPTAHAQRRTSAPAEAVRLVAEGRRLYRELEFLGAIEVLERALAMRGLPPARRAEALEVLGAALVVLDRDEEARRAFTELFALDPYYEVREPSGSPKIARFVARVRRDVVPDAALDPAASLELELPRAARVGHPTALRLRASPGVRSVRLFVRGAEETEFASIAANALGGALFVATVVARPRPDELELYAVGRDARGRVLTRAGSPLAPLVLPVRLGGGSNGEEWWLWTAIGGAVALGVVLGVVLGVSGADRAPPGTLPPGRVQLP